MKKTLRFALRLRAFAGTLFAGSERKTYEQAMKGNPADGVVVFLYGPDWEKVGPRLLGDLWKNPKVKSACGNANLVAIPLYQRPSEKDRKTAEEKGKGFRRTKRVRSVPALVLQSSAGADYYVICGDELLQPADKVVALMKEKFELYKKQRAILQKAERAKGREKAKLYGEAAAIEGVFPPPDTEKIIRENDPELKEPLSARAVFDVFKLLVDDTSFDDKKPEKRLLSVEETLAKLKELTAGERYTPRQKQEIYAACSGRLRRAGYDRAKLRKIYEEMIALDKESIWAEYAKEAIRLWCSQ